MEKHAPLDLPKPPTWTVIESEGKYREDWQTIEWGRARNAGFAIGRITMPTPMFWNADGASVKLDDMARGGSIMLVGREANDCVDAKCFAIGNGYRKCKPFIWSAFDEPKQYNVWNESYLKLVPLQMARICVDNIKVANYPFAFYFMRHRTFSSDNFWYENSIFSNKKTLGSDVFSSIKILYVLGYRNIYVYGVGKVDEDIASIIFKRSPGVNLYSVDGEISCWNKTSLDEATKETC